MARKKTPGQILKEEFMDPRGLSMNKLASVIDVPTNRISAIVKGTRAISADTAFRFSKCFGNSIEFWMDLQRDQDIIEIKKLNKGIKIKVIK